MAFVSSEKTRETARCKRTSCLKELELQLQGDSMSRRDNSMNLEGFKGQRDSIRGVLATPHSPILGKRFLPTDTCHQQLDRPTPRFDLVPPLNRADDTGTAFG